MSGVTDLNDYIYVYVIKNGKLTLDRSVSRSGLGPSRAKALVSKWEGRGYESFATIGTITRTPALS